VALETEEMTDNLLFLGANTRKLQNLGRIEGAAGNDNFLGRFDGSWFAAIGLRRARVGAVERLAIKVLDAIGLGQAALGLGKSDLSSECVQGEIKLVLLGSIGVLGCHGVIHVVARRGAAVLLIVHALGQTGKRLLGVAVRIGVVDIRNEHVPEGRGEGGCLVQRQQLRVRVDELACYGRRHRLVERGADLVGVDSEGLGCAHEGGHQFDILCGDTLRVDVEVQIAAEAVNALDKEIG
jgi:hypothetical protein